VHRVEINPTSGLEQIVTFLGNTRSGIQTRQQGLLISCILVVDLPVDRLFEWPLSVEPDGFDGALSFTAQCDVARCMHHP
jgi:hypothetical protein